MPNDKAHNVDAGKGVSYAQRAFRRVSMCVNLAHVRQQKALGHDSNCGLLTASTHGFRKQQDLKVREARCGQNSMFSFLNVKLFNLWEKINHQKDDLAVSLSV